MGEKEKNSTRRAKQGGQEVTGEVPVFAFSLTVGYPVLCKWERLENFSLPKSHLFSLQVPSLGSGLRVVSLFAPAARTGGVED